jgi:hypothetical protein
MNNLAYGSQQPEKVGPQVEEKLRKELGAPAPLPFQVEMAGTGGTTAGTVLADMARGLLGGHANTLFTLVFDLTAPRPAQLRAVVERQGVGCHVGPLLYSTPLTNAVKGEVTLEAPKMLGAPKLTGDAEVSAKLNAKGDLLKRLGKLARTEAEIGGLTLKLERLVKLTPHEKGALLVVGTLPRPTSMGMDAALDAKEFLDLATLIEGAL